MQTQSSSSSRDLRPIVWGLFVLSGACGLSYQVVWSRILTEILGSTALAIGTILSAFMAGLALGGWWLGKRGDGIQRPLRYYGILEIGIGLTAVVTTFLMQRVAVVYLPAYSLLGEVPFAVPSFRFVLVFALVMPTTILMGATLPVLARFSIRSITAIGEDLSSLYALNTVGAVVGTLATGFLLIGWLGITQTVLVAAALSVVLGCAAWILSHRYEEPALAGASSTAPDDELSSSGSSRLDPGTRALLLWSFGLSGVASFAYEIFWTRSLVHLIGNSTYAFTMMLTAFLSGLALGGYAVRFALRRRALGIRSFAATQIGIGVSAAAAMPLLFGIVSSDSLRDLVYRRSSEFLFLTAVQYGLALVVMLVPATLIGATFPLVGSLFVRDLRKTGADTGRVYAVNTLGNVVGALLPAVFVLGVYGIVNGIILVAVLNLSIGFVLLLRTSGRWVRLTPLPAFAFMGVAVLLPSAELGFQFPTWRQTSWDRVLFYREGLSATTKVVEDLNTGNKEMSVDGIMIGGTEFADYKQQLLAHLPKLLVTDPSTELSVGLGSGILAGESLRHSGIERLVCLEIEPTVARGARLFGKENHGLLSDPRLELVIDDVGHFLNTTRDRFDIISADEKTSDRYASNGFSYSADYYEMLASRLTPGGIVAQWMPNHIPPAQYRMVLKTFATSFPEVAIWYFAPVGKGGPTNTILVGGVEPFRFDVDEMNRRLRDHPEAFRGITKYGLESAEAVLAHFVCGGDVVRRLTADAPKNSLESPRYEFYSPLDYAASPEDRTRANLELVRDLRHEATFSSLESLLTTPAGDRLRVAVAAERSFFSAHIDQQGGAFAPALRQSLETAMEMAPWNANLGCQLLPFYWARGGRAFLAGDSVVAVELLGRATNLFPGMAELHFNYGLALLKRGSVQAGINQMRIAFELDPRLIGPHRHLVAAARRTGDTIAVEEHLRAILAVIPDDVQANAEFALHLITTGRDLELARRHLRRAAAVDASHPAVTHVQSRLSALAGAGD